MAVLTVFNPMPDGLSLPAAIDPIDAPVIVGPTSVSYDSNGGAFAVHIAGTGFKYAGGEPNAGTVTSLTVRNSSNQVVLKITGLDHSLVSLNLDLFGLGSPPFASREGSGFDGLTGLLTGDDFLNGSGGADNLGGYSDGNDVVKALAGADFVAGDIGNDSLNGGTGFDTLSYSQSYFDPRALRGVDVDAAAGTAIDPWGYNDTFALFEHLQGSKLADTLRGSARSETFSGLGGNDVIDGRGGFDTVVYGQDAGFDGPLGINANLGTGRIKDSFGNTDRVSGIEAVRGTFAKDAFIGSARDETFEGLAGKDSFNGKGGIDTIDFSSNTSPIAVAVALGSGSGQIGNDGWGQTENAVGIENIIGSRLADSLFGDNRANVLVGGGGADNLGGNGGSDTMTGSAGADRFLFAAPLADSGPNRNVDTVTDFRVGVDTLVLGASDFTALGGDLDQSEFRKGAAATNADQHLIYNPVNGGLFYDADGLGGAAQIQFALLSKNLALTTGDFAFAVG